MPKKSNSWFPLILTLAIQDLFREWKMSVCLSLGLAAVLAPLLVLFGVKFGLINTMSNRLKQNPYNLEIKPVGSGKYNLSWFYAMKKREDVGFIIPRTRTIAATMRFRSMKKNARNMVLLDLIPTTTGDPILETQNQMSIGQESVILSARAARKLNIATGDQVWGIINRVIKGRSEFKKIKLQVIDVLSEEKFNREAVFVSLDLLVATENFRDGKPFDLLNKDADNVSEFKLFSSFRLYAKTIYDVTLLEKYLRDSRIEVRTKAMEIDTVISLDKNLSIVFWVVASVGSLGFLFSLGANVLANIDRKRKELSVLRLIGFSTMSIVSFPVIQAGLIGILGSIIACFVFLFIQSFLNILFSSYIGKDEMICFLMPYHYGISFIFTICISIMASILGGYQAASIEPNEGLRDV